MSTNVGFTLIELLVAVLIIGILAAVALPQYQKAVEKSRFMKYFQIAQGIRRSQEVYYLANNTYTTGLEELDIDFVDACPLRSLQDTGDFQCPFGRIDNITGGLTSASSRVRVWFYSSGYTAGKSGLADCDLSVWFEHSDYPGEITCTGYTKSGRALCAHVAGLKK